MSHEVIYTVHENGDVYSTHHNKYLKPLNRGGYLQVDLGFRRPISVARLVAQVFIPITENKPHVNHKDGNKFNNSVENLEWCTPSENIQHAYDTGLNRQTSGDENHNTKVLESDLPIIKKLYADGLAQWRIGQIYGVDQSHISRIVNGHKRGRITQCQI